MSATTLINLFIPWLFKKVKKRYEFQAFSVNIRLHLSAKNKVISFQASVSKGWLHENGKFIFDDRYYMDPWYRFLQDKKINAFVRKEFGEYPIYYMEANLMQAPFVHEDQVLIGGIQPNLILAMTLGATFISFPDKDADVKGIPLENISGTGDIPPLESVLNHPFILELSTQVIRMNREHPEMKVIPPFFWDLSGRATIHGILTTALKLMGENSLLLMITDPELLHHIHQWIVEIYAGLIDHFARLVNFPVTSIHVGECSGTMISGDQYAQFITPYVSQFGEKYGRVRLHSCGPTDHLVNAISTIEGLSVIDTGSNTSIALIREKMGVNFEINVEPPFRLMLKETPERNLEEWLHQTLVENRGGPLKIVMHLEHGYSMEGCFLIHDVLRHKNND